MEKWIYAVHTVCTDPSRDKEFNDWYDNIHLPDLLTSPGLLRATRYEIGEPVEGEGQYLAMYQIEAEDIGQVMAGMRENVSKRVEQGRMSDLSQVVKRVLYKQIAEKLKD